MACILPPVQVQGDPLKKLSNLRLYQVDGALSDCKVDLSSLRQAHVRNEESRQQAKVREQNRQLRREAKAERLRLRHAAATQIQAFIRSVFCRRHIMPAVLEAKRIEELEKSRVALSDTMLGLHQNIHDLAYVAEDRLETATRIQAWWRGILAKRIVAIIKIRRHVHAMSLRMAKAATSISAIVRGRQARMGCSRLRTERERRIQQAKKAHNDRMLKAVIKLQSHCRRRAAIKTTKARRAILAKELEGDRAGTPTEEKNSRKSPDRADRARRKRNAESHGHGKLVSTSVQGASPKQRGAANNEQGLAAFEGGGMLVVTAPSEPRRKSFGGAALKVKKNPRKLQTVAS